MATRERVVLWSIACWTLKPADRPDLGILLRPFAYSFRLELGQGRSKPEPGFCIVLRVLRYGIFDCTTAGTRGLGSTWLIAMVQKFFS